MSKKSSLIFTACLLHKNEPDFLDIQQLIFDVIKVNLKFLKYVDINIDLAVTE